MTSISALAKRHLLSRSTLLYYDAIGLLRPSVRTRSDYRHYSPEDERRLERICLLRRTGLPLKEIQHILDSSENLLNPALQKRLVELEEEMQTLRSQQRLIANLLKEASRSPELSGMNKAVWVAILRAAGFQDMDMQAWHREFERLAPSEHQRFLENLGIPEEEIATIRTTAISPSHRTPLFFGGV